MEKTKSNICIIIFLLLFSVLNIFFAILIGTVNISPIYVFRVIVYNLFGYRHYSIEQSIINIIWEVRVPRVIMAFIVGASLSMGGVLVQAILKNPLASPFTMGVSSGSSLGVSTVIITGASIPFLGLLFRPLVGFISGLVAVIIVIKFTSYVDKKMTTTAIVLTGMVFSMFYNALQTLIIVISRSDVREVMLWQMGSFSMRGWTHVYAILPFFILALIGSFFFINELDIITLGEEDALSVGVDVKKVRKKLLIISAIFTGSAVALSGVIGFVDLITPHIARRVVGSKHIYVIPVAMLIGGNMMVATDLIARTIIAPIEIPVGAVTALIGAPFFAYIFFKGKRASY
jgi:iron complex transport system permease protein